MTLAYLRPLRTWAVAEIVRHALRPSDDLIEELIAEGAAAIVTKIGRVLDRQLQDASKINRVIENLARRQMSDSLDRLGCAPVPAPSTRRKRRQRGQPAFLSGDFIHRIPLDDGDRGQPNDGDERFYARTAPNVERLCTHVVHNLRNKAQGRIWLAVCVLTAPTRFVEPQGRQKGRWTYPSLSEVARAADVARQTLRDAIEKLATEIVRSAPGEIDDLGEKILGKNWTSRREK